MKSGRHPLWKASRSAFGTRPYFDLREVSKAKTCAHRPRSGDGDRVATYLPLILGAVIAMLAVPG